jgi:serine protease Do
MRRTILPMLMLAAAAPMAEARQTVPPAPPAPRAPRVRYFSSSDGDRALLGITTVADGKRDTLGVLVEAVTAGGPAEKAGLEEGNRIGSINGVSLKLSRDDAGEPDMSGAMSNRLVREMRKLKPGDEATLEVWNGARYRTVKVKTVAASDLAQEWTPRKAAQDRAALGIALGSTGSKRDTLGVFVSGVTENGPAEKAGIVEGVRIASINGVDLRVPREDIGDMSVSSARVSRLQREVAKLKPGQTVDLSIVEGGRTRAVKVTLGNAKDLQRDEGFSSSTGDGPGVFVMPRIRADLNREMPRIRAELDREMPRIRAELDRDLPRIREDINLALPQAMEEIRRSMDEMRLELPQLRTRLGRRVII